MVTVKIAIPMYCECGWEFRNRNDDTMDCLNPKCAHHGKVLVKPTLEAQAHEVKPEISRKELRAVPDKTAESIIRYRKTGSL